MTIFRRGEAADLAEVAAIQSASASASQWDVASYLDHEFLVAIADGVLAGFLVARVIDASESEILNLAVDPLFRRHRIGTELLRNFLLSHSGKVFLEVRESNRAARNLYKTMGFAEVGSRPQYYRDPLETGIVMMFHS